jgi:hypothetical protein
MTQPVLLGALGINELLIVLLPLLVIIFIATNAIKQYKAGKTKRPPILTVICSLIFILGSILLVVSLSNYEEFSKQVGSGNMVLGILLLGGGIIGAVGLWQMKRWGAFVFIGTQIVNIIISFSDGSIKDYNYLPFVFWIFCIGVVLFHFKKLTD